MKKAIAFTLAILTVFAVATAFVSCNSENENSAVVGTWTSAMLGRALEFHSDGTVERSSVSKSEKYKYTVDGNKIKIDGINAEYILDGDTITEVWSYGENGAINVVYTKNK